MSNWSGAAAVAVAVAMSGCSSEDSRCSVQNCTALWNCKLRPPGAIDATCLRNSTPEDFRAAAVQSCVEACNANGAGASIGCVAEKFPGPHCESTDQDAGRSAAFEVLQAACFPLVDAGSFCGTNCTSCASACQANAIACNAGCAALDGGACLDCNYACNQRAVSCQQGCPSS